MPGLASLIRRYPLTKSVTRQPGASPADPPKPFVQWVGGKREMIPQYQKFLPASFKRYYEPFLGGGAMFFHLDPRKAVLGDSNPELILAYQGVRDQVEEVISLLKRLRARHSDALYKEMRSVDRQVKILEKWSSAEIAARLIYLNQTCFNAIYRVNKRGEFNVPIGSSLNRAICDPVALTTASVVLRRARIEVADFESLVKGASEGDFVYLDPPYFPVSEYSDFTRYTKEKFYKDDQRRLKIVIDDLAGRGCLVMMSNSDAPFIRELYSGYYVHTVSSGRNLNSRAEKRGKVAEVLVVTYPTGVPASGKAD